MTDTKWKMENGELTWEPRSTETTFSKDESSINSCLVTEALFIVWDQGSWIKLMPQLVIALLVALRKGEADGP
jgi:hypothetical protein